jgi:group II intron reverse transcriptase/maturase
MSNEKGIKKIDDLRHNEYYDMQKIFDELYSKSQSGNTFDDIMDIILSENNILLAYRNIKANGGSITPGTDGLNIQDIASLTAEEVVGKVRYITRGSEHGYRPKPVRRKEIPKPNGKTRPLGIPCIWDRLIQQCILQVMQPICEAKFSSNSYGFRPLRSAENAIARTYRMLQMSNLYHVIEFDIKGFFDNVDHRTLIKQIWNAGIRDKKLIWIIKQILKGPIKLENGEIKYPTKGTPQGGILSPLLANIVLNDLDKWVESQWQTHPVTTHYKQKVMKNGSTSSHAFRGMQETTKLKEMWIVRYADDFRIFCRKHKDAKKVLIATTKWLKERLKLDVSEEKTRIIDARKQYMEFLGFKIKVKWNYSKQKYTVESHISDKALADKSEKLIEQAKRICHVGNTDQEVREIVVYNSIVTGLQNYYRIATDVAGDLNHIQQRTYHLFYNGLNTQSGQRLVRTGRELTDIEKQKYGKYKSLRFVKGTGEPIYPIYAVQFKNPMAFNANKCLYTPEGRAKIHDKLNPELNLLWQLQKQYPKTQSIEYYDNRLSLYSMQNGKCYVLGKPFMATSEIHCHHKKARKHGGTDEFSNLVLIHEDVHKLIHATQKDTIQKYLEMLKLNAEQIRKVNYLRYMLGLTIIKEYNKKGHLLSLETVESYLDI